MWFLLKLRSQWADYESRKNSPMKVKQTGEADEDIDLRIGIKYITQNQDSVELSTCKN